VFVCVSLVEGAAVGPFRCICSASRCPLHTRVHAYTRAHIHIRALSGGATVTYSSEFPEAQIIAVPLACLCMCVWVFVCMCVRACMCSRMGQRHQTSLF
jgi:hypothetical protein